MILFSFLLLLYEISVRTFQNSVISLLRYILLKKERFKVSVFAIIEDVYKTVLKLYIYESRPSCLHLSFVFSKLI